ncbi:RNA polymerase sigma factor [Archangium sp.]|uniref:RNA polymerase sigma factor n=1 Tax=Archangium sp. TaxID=1872627 RepID=UPI002869EE9D|nr:RNA polymerase sigma factor [Archangium sp.]
MAMDEATSERELVQRLLRRDEAAFVRLVDTYHSRLLRLALPLVGSRSVAEETVQDTWVAILDGLEGFEGRCSLKTWMFHILLNRARSRAAKEGRTLPFSALGPADEGTVVESERFTAAGAWAVPPSRWGVESPETLVLRGEALAYLEEILAELPPNQRAVVTLRDVEELEPEEVCVLLQLSESNQRVLLHRGRAKLRRALEERFGDAR